MIRSANTELDKVDFNGISPPLKKYQNALPMANKTTHRTNNNHRPIVINLEGT
jgi:hypothetical protein